MRAFIVVRRALQFALSARSRCADDTSRCPITSWKNQLAVEQRLRAGHEVEHLTRMRRRVTGRRRDHVEARGFERVSRARHVPGVGDEIDAPDARGFEHAESCRARSRAYCARSPRPMSTGTWNSRSAPASSARASGRGAADGGAARQRASVSRARGGDAPHSAGASSVSGIDGVAAVFRRLEVGAASQRPRSPGRPCRTAGRVVRTAAAAGAGCRDVAASTGHRGQTSATSTRVRAPPRGATPRSGEQRDQQDDEHDAGRHAAPQADHRRLSGRPIRRRSGVSSRAARSLTQAPDFQ